MAAAYNAGAAAKRGIEAAFPTVRDAVLNTILPARPLAQATLPTIGEFISGLTGGAAPLGPTATVKLPAPKPVAAKGKAGSVLDLIGNDPNRAAGATSKVAADPFTAMLGAVAAAHGGKVSINDLADLSAIAYKRAAATPRPITAKDAAGLAIMGLADQNFTATMQQAQAAKAAGNINAAQQLQESAVRQRMQDLQSILGANPFDLAAVAQMQASGDAE